MFEYVYIIFSSHQDNICPEFGSDKNVFNQTVGSPPIRWIHNDSMYVRFGGIRNTKTWSMSNHTLIFRPFGLIKTCIVFKEVFYKESAMNYFCAIAIQFAVCKYVY